MADSVNSQRQCANSRNNRAYCHAELAVSSPAVAVTIAITHYAYPRTDGQAELAWVVWLNAKTDGIMYTVGANGHRCHY